MYEGELVTLKIAGKDNLIATSLIDYEGIIDENGLLIRNKNTGEALGYFEAVYGINFYDMMTFFGYEYDAEDVDKSTL